MLVINVVNEIKNGSVSFILVKLNLHIWLLTKGHAVTEISALHAMTRY